MKASASCHLGRMLAPLALVLACSCPASAQPLQDRVTATIRGVTYQLNIREEWETATTPLPPPALVGREETHPGQDLVRLLTIHCIDSCQAASSYHEKIFDSPISAFRLWDGSPDLITIWAGGSSYWVRIYHVGNRGIAKVLDEATRSAPQFGFAADGSPVVMLNNPDAPRPGGGFHVSSGTWKWDGRRFQPTVGETNGIAR